MNNGYEKKGIVQKALFLCIGFILLGQIAYAGQVNPVKATASLLDKPGDNQEHLVSVKFKNELLTDVLHELARKVNVGISYDTRTIPPKLITYEAENESVYTVLDASLEGTGLYITLSENRKVIVIKKEPLLQLKKVQEEISGQVTDEETGETLPGVNIMIKGTNTGTSTDQSGSYELTVPTLQDTIVVSFIGYETQEIPINGRTEIDIQLVSETVEGEELVVTAFGETQEAQDVIGAVTSVSTEELEQLRTAPSSNLTTSLVGRIPGLIGYQRSGEPGANNTDFFVRGVTSFGYSKNPLILIDNIESSTTDLARLNPNDIANFSVLKDATATSLYGSRAANGVLLIKTKEGYEGRLEVDVRVENSISEPTDVPEFADPVTYMKKANEATLSRDPLAPLPYSRRKIDKTEAGANPYLYPAVDWREELFKDYTANQRFNLNVSGGGSIAQYYVSGSIDQSNGLLKVPELSKFNNNIDLKSYSMRSNININLTQSTTLKMKLGGNFDDYGGPLNSGEEVYEQIVSANPVRFPARFPVDSAHAYTEHPLFGSYEGPGGREFNPYAEMVKGYKDYSRSKINAQFSIDQDFSSLVQGLQVGALINVERYAFSSNSRAYQPYYYEASPVAIGSDDYTLRLLNPDGGTNYLDYTPLEKTVTSALFLQTQANYNRTFRDKHGVSGLFVFNARNETYDNVDNLQASLPHRNVNLAGRLTYNYNSIYYAEFNFGLNASERFEKNHRWGFFPSVGLAWQISNEDFWEPISSVITRFKVRTTYGLSGNDAIGAHDNRFKYLSTVNLDDPAYGFATGSDASYHRNGISISRYSNPSITWERAQKLNLGIEFMLFDQLDAEANFYRENRSNILQNRSSIPGSMGLSDIPRANTGEIESEGFSTNITYSANMSNWLLQVRGNFTYARNKYVKVDEPRFPNSPNRSKIGQPIGRQFGLYAERLFVDQAEVENSPEQNFGPYGPGDIKYRDINGDGQITDLDRVPMGFPENPEITYGFGFSLGYRNIDFSAFFQGLARTSFWIDPTETAPFVNGHQLLKVFAEDHWTRNNRNLTALYPHFSTESRPEGESNNAQLSSWWMRDGSFLRIKDVQIGYRLPQSIVSKLSMRSMRVYVNCRNLAHFSKYKLWDPEMAGNGLGYPLQRAFNIGLNIKF